jgi:hypothetical protein
MRSLGILLLQPVEAGRAISQKQGKSDIRTDKKSSDLCEESGSLCKFLVAQVLVGIEGVGLNAFLAGVFKLSMLTPHSSHRLIPLALTPPVPPSPGLLHQAK